MSVERRIIVTEEDNGQRLDRWLKKNVADIPYGLAQKLIRKGAIWIDGTRTKNTETRLTAGQEVRVPAVEDRAPVKKPSFVPGANDADYIQSMVIYDDGDVVALNKPGDIASQGGGGVERHIDGLLPLLADRKDRRPRLIHRLDRETSGVLLCARSGEAVRRLGSAFLHRQAQKIYLAVVTPAPPRDEGTIEGALIKASGPIKDRMVISDDEEAKPATTDFVVLERIGKQAAYVAFLPRTGRTHQIRVHAADALGCPILGDGKYGGAKAAEIPGVETADRLHLHARRLMIPDPASGKTLDISAPLPPYFVETLRALGCDTHMAEQRLAGILDR